MGQSALLLKAVVSHTIWLVVRLVGGGEEVRTDGWVDEWRAGEMGLAWLGRRGDEKGGLHLSYLKHDLWNFNRVRGRAVAACASSGERSRAV